jgi:hypothetical protein
VGDIEKLLGTKLEIEAIELEAERRPGGRFNDGQRAWRDDSAREPREPREPRAARPQPAPRAPRAPADPLFDQPYEAKAASEAPPAWETAQRSAAPRGLSPNIKTRRKVAALFKAPAPAPAENG